MSKKVINIFSPFYFPQINGMSFVVQKNVEAALALNYNVNVLTFNGATPISTEHVFTFDIFVLQKYTLQLFYKNLSFRNI